MTKRQKMKRKAMRKRQAECRHFSHWRRKRADQPWVVVCSICGKRSSVASAVLASMRVQWPDARDK